jgi:hypothetical protein
MVTVLPLLTVPPALVYAPPLIEYVPPVIEMGPVVLSPNTVIVFDVITALKATPVRSIKVNGSGVVPSCVVTLKASDPSPMVSVASVVVE